MGQKYILGEICFFFRWRCSLINKIFPLNIKLSSVLFPKMINCLKTFAAEEFKMREHPQSVNRRLSLVQRVLLVDNGFHPMDYIFWPCS